MKKIFLAHTDNPGVVLECGGLPRGCPYHLIKEIPVGGDGGWDYVFRSNSEARVLYVSHGTKVVAIDLNKMRSLAKLPIRRILDLRWRAQSAELPAHNCRNVPAAGWVKFHCCEPLNTHSGIAASGGNRWMDLQLAARLARRCRIFCSKTARSGNPYGN